MPWMLSEHPYCYIFISIFFPFVSYDPNNVMTIKIKQINKFTKTFFFFPLVLRRIGQRTEGGCFIKCLLPKSALLVTLQELDEIVKLCGGMTSYTRAIKQDYTERKCRCSVEGGAGVKMTFCFYKSLFKINTFPAQTVCISENNFAVDVLVIIPHCHYNIQCLFFHQTDERKQNGS